MTPQQIRQRITDLQKAMIMIRAKEKSLVPQWDKQDLKDMQGHIDRLTKELQKVNKKDV